MKTPTRIHKGKRQILFEGVWCDVPHGYRAGDEVNTKHKATMRAVNNAKEILGDETDLWTKYSDLLDEQAMATSPRYIPINKIVFDELSKKMSERIDAEILNGLLGRIDGFTIYKSPALPLDRKQNDE